MRKNDKKICKKCIKKYGLLKNSTDFLLGECKKCGKSAFCQKGRHKIVDFVKFFDAEAKRGRIKNV